MKIGEMTPFQGTWLISFADLITLLLCAFLMFFSLNFRSGIPIAHTPLEEPIGIAELTLQIEVKDLNSEGNKVSKTMLEKLKKHIESVSYDSFKVELTLCENGASDDQTIGRLMSVGRQLVDIGVTQDLVRYRVLGDDCSVLQDGTVGLIKVLES